MAKHTMEVASRQRVQADQCSAQSSEMSPQHGPETQDAPRPLQEGRATLESDCVLKAAVKRMQQLGGTGGRESGLPSVHNAWVKGQQAAARLGRGLANTKAGLILQCEHWLEAADPKHRYGTNLRPYFDAYLCEEVRSQNPAFRSRLLKDAEQPADGDSAAARPAAGKDAAAADNGTCGCPCADAPGNVASSSGSSSLLTRRRTASAPHLHGLDGCQDPDAASTLPQPHAPDGAPAPAAPLPQEMLPETFGGSGAGQRGFFYWLDEGTGVGLDLADRGVPRGKLECERVKYLCEREREQFEVVVRQEDGRLVYKVSGELVDTTAPAPASASPKAGRSHGGLTHVPSAPAALSAADAGLCQGDGSGRQQQQQQTQQQQKQQQEQEHQQEQASRQHEKQEPLPDQQQHLPQQSERGIGMCALDGGAGDETAGAGPHTAATAPAALSTPPPVCKPCKWIYVLDTCQRLYVHAKFRGKFHHSSFLQGGAVLAAGGIAVEAGHIKKLTADSGHYRPDVDAFMAMVDMLKSMGADLSDTQLTAKHISLGGV